MSCCTVRTIRKGPRTAVAPVLAPGVVGLGLRRSY